MKSAKISQSEYETLATLRYSLRQFLRFSEDAARASGLAPQQHQALLAIKGFSSRDPFTVGDLAERLQIRHHSAVGLVGRLVKNGLLRRAHSTSDRRQARLTLTPRGERVLARLSATHKEQLRQSGAQIEALLQRLRQ